MPLVYRDTFVICEICGRQYTGKDYKGTVRLLMVHNKVSHNHVVSVDRLVKNINRDKNRKTLTYEQMKELLNE